MKYPGTSSYGAPRKLISYSVRAAQAQECPACRTRFGYVRFEKETKMKQSIILSTHGSVFDFCNDRTHGRHRRANLHPLEVH